jgi:hypothetical protein
VTVPLAALPWVEWQEPDSGQTVRLYADLVKDESPGLPAVVTKHPIEKGAPITDHFRKDLETFRATFYFSGSPLRGDLDPDNAGSVRTYKLPKIDYSQQVHAPIYTPGGLTNAATGAIASGVKALFGGSLTPDSFQALGFDIAPAKRFAKVIELIRRLQTQAILVTVHTTLLGDFEQMAITMGEPKRSADLNDGMDLALTFEQVLTVSSDVSFGAPLPKEPRAQTKKTGVSGNGNDVEPQKKSSVIAAMADKFRLPL